MAFKKHYKPVIVEWEDACAHHGYYEESKPQDYSTLLCRCPGYLMTKTKKEVKLAREIFEDGQIREIQVIPRGMVRKITYLEEKAK